MAGVVAVPAVRRGTSPDREAHGLGSGRHLRVRSCHGRRRELPVQRGFVPHPDDRLQVGRPKRRAVVRVRSFRDRASRRPRARVTYRPQAESAVWAFGPNCAAPLGRHLVGCNGVA